MLPTDDAGEPNAIVGEYHESAERYEAQIGKYNALVKEKTGFIGMRQVLADEYNCYPNIEQSTTSWLSVVPAP